MDLDGAIAEASHRRANVAAELQITTEEFQAARLRGVELEKVLLGVDGELKALGALKAASNGE